MRQAPDSIGWQPTKGMVMAFVQDGDLPDYLSAFEAVEVIGCDTNSLELFLAKETAFGVHPHQLKNQGWVSKTPTAMVLYHLEEVRLYGLWRITGRQVSSGTQIVTVEPLEKCPALGEECWHQLLAYTEEPDEDEYTGYTFPQLLEKDDAKSLIRMFWYAKTNPALISNMGAAEPEGQTHCHQLSPELQPLQLFMHRLL